MIFVSLGTNDKSFDRLLKAIDREITLGNIKDKVIVQSGYTKYDSDNMEIIDLMSMDMFNECISNCDLLITHGGVGTILDGLKKNKKILAFPRLMEYGEHVNNHQLEIINKFSSDGYILTGKIDDLGNLLKNLSSFKPKKYVSNNSKFNKKLCDVINKF